MTERFDVFVVGDASLDILFTGLPHLPVLGEDTLATGFDMLPGEAYTTAVALHRLGVKVAWAANFGNDSVSQMILDQVRKEGLDERFLVRHHRPYRRVSVAASFEQERGFMTYYDPEPGLPAALSALPRVDAGMIFIPGLLYGKMFEAAYPIIQLKKMKLVMDGNCNTGISIQDKAVRNAIRKTDVFLPNAKEARTLTGREVLADAIHALGEICPLVVVKSGTDGSYAFDGREIIHVETTPVKALDTTGAGDVFDAGFLKAYLDGKPLADCLRWGNIAAAYSIQGYGGTGYHITAAMIEKQINS
jgi:sugar/nucleoside kinase (ribokinase family)